VVAGIEELWMSRVIERGGRSYTDSPMMVSRFFCHRPSLLCRPRIPGGCTKTNATNSLRQKLKKLITDFSQSRVNSSQ
jgi:hypothetical protein